MEKKVLELPVNPLGSLSVEVEADRRYVRLETTFGRIGVVALLDREGSRTIRNAMAEAEAHLRPRKEEPPPEDRMADDGGPAPE